MDDYASLTPGHWHKAFQELQGLADNYANFQGITPYLTYAQSQAGQEQAPSTISPTGLNPVLVVVLILLLLVVLGAVLFVIMKRRVQPAAVAQYQYTPTGAGAYPQNRAFGAYSPTPGYIPPAPGSLPETYPPKPESYTAASGYESMANLVPQTPPLRVSAPLSPQPAQAPANGSAILMPPTYTSAAPGSSVGAPPTQQANSFERNLPTWVPSAQTTEQAPSVGQQSMQPLPMTPALPEQQEENTALARTFSVPRRPSLPLTDNVPAEQQIWVAPCGHINTLEVRFCRVCGQPIAAAASQDTTNVSWP